MQTESPITAHADRDLLEAAADGDEHALGELYDRHSGVMFGLAMRMLNNREDAADLVHDVMLEAWQRAPDFQPEKSSVRSWLILRLRSRALDRLRHHALKNRKLDALAQDPVATDASTNDNMDGAFDLHLEQLAGSLAGLSEPHRTVLQLCYFKGLSCSEVAARTQTPLTTIKSRLAAALKQLKQHLNPAESSTD